MSGETAPDRLKFTMQDALDDATAVVIAVHGIGDHTSVDLLHSAESGVAALWHSKAQTARIALNDFPIVRDVNVFGLQRNETAALQLSVDNHKHVLVPVVWSGNRYRSGRIAEKGEGPVALWLALPTLIGICLDFLRCVPRARGIWSLGVLAPALFISVFLSGAFFAFFYLQVHVPIWINAPFSMSWYTPLFAIGSFYAFAFVATKLSVLFDLIGDVAHYIASRDQRVKNIGQFSELFEFVATRAPSALIVVVGHSLGSVLVSQALLNSQPKYSGHGRTVLITMGSPLRLMSRIFPAEIETPAQLAARFGVSIVVLGWVNLWRDQDFIGKALHASSKGGFLESSLGPGGHANYWGDARVWISISTFLERAVSGAPQNLAKAWRQVPLTESERIWSLDIWRRARVGRSFAYGLILFALIYQFQLLAPWERQFSAAVHILIFVAWNVGTLSLGWALFCLWPDYTPQMTPRELLQHMIFKLTRAKGALIFGCLYLGLFSVVVAEQSTGFLSNWLARIM